MYKATLHRVLNTARGTPRMSAPFFYEPCFEAVLAPAPQLCRCGAPSNAHVKVIRQGPSVHADEQCVSLWLPQQL